MTVVPVDATDAVVKGEASTVLLIVDLVLVVLIIVALWVASRRGSARRKRARAARGVSELADLIPGRAVTEGGDRPTPRRVVPGVAARSTTWSASSERGETVPPADSQPVAPEALEPALLEPALLEPAPLEPVAATANGIARAARRGVVVAPRGRSWVVRRDGASRVSSVHSSRDAAESRGRKTAQRERVVLEVRDGESAVLDRTDYSSGDGANN
jgi:Uncharacterized protein conserved in bacteria (DUF2188)